MSQLSILYSIDNDDESGKDREEEEEEAQEEGDKEEAQEEEEEEEVPEKPQQLLAIRVSPHKTRKRESAKKKDKAPDPVFLMENSPLVHYFLVSWFMNLFP